tara:strand:- start:40 stop:375 length:336 start_codon:yes stop_codon:yes gene_type:complete
MENITELLQQLNTMQTNHIKLLEERIEVISEHRQHLNKTISRQAEQLQTANTRIELGKEMQDINDDTISKLFTAAKKDKEVIKEFKQLINQQGEQIKTLALQKEVINNVKD